MKRIIAVFLFLIVFCCACAQADILTNRVDVTSPTRSYIKVGTATLTDPNRNGYLILSLYSGSDASYALLDIFKNTYGSVSDIPGLSDYLPGSEYLDIANWGLNFVSKDLHVYVQMRDPKTGEIIWDGTWKNDKEEDCPFYDGKIIELGCDHPAYEIWIKNWTVMGHTFAKLDIAENITWSGAD